LLDAQNVTLLRAEIIALHWVQSSTRTSYAARQGSAKPEARVVPGRGRREPIARGGEGAIDPKLAEAICRAEDRKSNRTGGWRRADVTIAGWRVTSAAREPTERDGDEVAISEGAEWAWRVACRGLGAGRGTSLAGGDDGRGLRLHFLVKDVLIWRFGQGTPVGYGIEWRVVPGRRPGSAGSFL